MNQQVYDLVMAILRSDLPRQTQEEIVRFYTLPRNTPVKGLIEVPDNSPDVGPVSRPTVKDEQRSLNPKRAEAEDAVAETLKGRI